MNKIFTKERKTISVRLDKDFCIEYQEYINKVKKTTINNHLSKIILEDFEKIKKGE